MNTFRDNEVVVYKDSDAVGIVLIDFPCRSHNEIPAQNTKLGMEERFVVRRFWSTGRENEGLSMFVFAQKTEQVLWAFLRSWYGFW